MSKNHSLSRRGFLKVAAIGLGSLVPGSYRRQLSIEMTAVPSPTVTPRALPPGAVADTVLVNGKVVTMDAANTVSQAVAISGSRVLQTGTNEAIRALAGPQTRSMDLRGRIVTPGFVDAHNHLSASGLIGTAYIDINPPAVRSIADLQAKIAEGCARTPPGKWVIAQGYISFEGHFPDKYDIAAMLYEDDYLRFGGYKFLLDGAGVAAYTHEPHKGVAWNLATWDAKQLKEVVSTLHDLGYQCAFHVIGDAAVDMALDAIEYAMNKNPRPDPRHRLEHAVLNTDKALVRTRDLGVVVSTQPHAIRLLGDYWRKTWGEERTARIIPTRAWLEMGVPLSLSSDAPTMPWWKPQNVLTAALTRTSASKIVIGPEQRLTIDEAMRAYTMGGAYADFEEHIKGSLEPGKFADLVVWTEDPYVLLPEDLFNSTVDMTMVGGKIVYERT